MVKRGESRGESRGEKGRTMRRRLIVVFAMLVGFAVALPASAPTNVAPSDYVAMRDSFSSGHGSPPDIGGALSRLVRLLVDRGGPLGKGSFIPAVFPPGERSSAVVSGVRSRGGLSGLPVGLRTVASAAIGAQERRFWVLRHGSSLVASGGGIASVFNAGGVRLRVAGGSLRLSLAGVGYGDRLVPVTAALPAAIGSSVSYGETVVKRETLISRISRRLGRGCGRLGGWRSGRLCATRGQTDISGVGYRRTIVRRGGAAV